MEAKRPRVVVGVDDTPAGWCALRAAVAAAQERGATLYAVRALRPATAARTPMLPLLREDLVAEAYAVVRDAFARALGRAPDDLDIQMAAVDGPVGRALVGSADRPGDLLVVGARRRHRALGHQPSRYCIAHALCPVLVVPAPEMARSTSTRSLVKALNHELEHLLANDDRAGVA